MKRREFTSKWERKKGGQEKDSGSIEGVSRLPEDTGQRGIPRFRVGFQTLSVQAFVGRCAHFKADPGSVDSAFSFNPRGLPSGQVTAVGGQGLGALKRGTLSY